MVFIDEFGVVGAEVGVKEGFDPNPKKCESDGCADDCKRCRCRLAKFLSLLILF